MTWIKKHWWKATIIIPVIIGLYWLMIWKRRADLQQELLWRQQEHNRKIVDIANEGHLSVFLLDRAYINEKEAIEEEIRDLAGRPQALADKMNKLWGKQ